MAAVSVAASRVRQRRAVRSDVPTAAASSLSVVSGRLARADKTAAFVPAAAGRLLAGRGRVRVRSLAVRWPGSWPPAGPLAERRRDMLMAVSALARLRDRR